MSGCEQVAQTMLVQDMMKNNWAALALLWQ